MTQFQSPDTRGQIESLVVLRGRLNQRQSRDLRGVIVLMAVRGLRRPINVMGFRRIKKAYFFNGCQET